MPVAESLLFINLSARMPFIEDEPGIHPDDAFCSTAAKLKAAHRISFADSF